MIPRPPRSAVYRSTTLFRSPNANGAATVTVRLHDNGGVANGGVDTSAPQTFTITVTAINDAPSFTVPATAPTVNEDAGAQTVAGFATNISAGPNEAGQLVDFTCPTCMSNTNNVGRAARRGRGQNSGVAVTLKKKKKGGGTLTGRPHKNGGVAQAPVITSGP